jgi:hypothetical protein
MIIIPELELVKWVTLGLDGLMKDYDNASDKDDSIIAKLYKGLVYEKVNFYEQAVVLFVTNRKNTQNTSNRKITVKSYYDRTIRNTPAIHISAPTENETQMAIGAGADEYVEFNDNDTINSHRRKTYDSKNAIFFTSDNHLEVQIMYYTVRCMLQSIFDTYSMTTHQNPKMMGNELRMDDTNGTPPIFIRALFIDSFSEMNVPNFFYSENFSKLIFPRSNSFESGHIGDEKLIINP